MRSAEDIAKYFIKNGVDTNPNTEEGNAKLQNLLALSNMIHIAKYGKPLFKDDVIAVADKTLNNETMQDINSDGKTDVT